MLLRKKLADLPNAENEAKKGAVEIFRKALETVRAAEEEKARIIREKEEEARLAREEEARIAREKEDARLAQE